MAHYFIYFFLALILALIFTIFTGRLARRWGILDMPGGGRKIHARPTPLLGGLAIYLSFFLILSFAGRYLLAGNLHISHWLGFALGGLIIMIGGFLDDKYDLRPWQQFIFPILAAVCIVFSGVEIARITNPFGGFIVLPALVSALIIIFWLLGLMYTTKLLDGVDGLVSGVTFIGALIIFLFTLTTHYYQPDIALAAAVLMGSVLGFLIFNWHPAKIFLGEGGSLFCGFALGVLAIISGGKIAVTLLVMGIPILDVAWTIIRRLGQGKNPFRFSDSKHLHHRLLALGLGQRGTVLVFYALALSFGLAGLFLQSRGKLLALGLLLLLMFLIVVLFSVWEKKKPKLLLQVCCAPCSAYTASQILAAKYQVTLYYYNPNIDNEAEYLKRLAAVKFVAEKYHLPLLIESYNHPAWLKKVQGQEQAPEHGVRCATCLRARIKKTALVAKDGHYDLFGTSLTASPFKDSAQILGYGRELAKEIGVKFLDLDFKDNDGWHKSLTLAKDLDIYRQKYCGCEFAKR
ncbi:MAG TPA: epoxyqueuosine reductase QueH [bacterium]|nr:epoxyqueuosine reductase QueH [bacterium]HPT30153.1 epoxyqueuosine reductase QueH [bacterium]